MGAILTANCLILPERFSPQRWWRDVAATGATIVHYLGVVPPLLLNQRAGARGARARGALRPRRRRRAASCTTAFEKRFGFPLIEVWGMTETGRVLADAASRARSTRAPSAAPSGGFEARVVDDEDRDVPDDTPGELLVR